MDKHPLTWCYISQGHSVCTNTVDFGAFPGFCELLVQMRQNFVPLGGGGGYCVYFLKSVRKGRFRNGWVWGEGVYGHIFKQTELQIGQCVLQICSTVRYETRCLMPLLSGVLVPLCMHPLLLSGGGGVYGHIFKQTELQIGQCVLQICSTVRYETRCLMPLLSGVLVPLCMHPLLLSGEVLPIPNSPLSAHSGVGVY